MSLTGTMEHFVVMKEYGHIHITTTIRTGSVRNEINPLFEVYTVIKVF